MAAVASLTDIAFLADTASAVSAAPTAVGKAVLNLLATVGVFVAIGTVGFTLITFAHDPLEVVSDTVAHSFLRAFLAGLLGELLAIPTLGMLVVGLVLTLAGTLLLPFVLVLFALLLVLGIGGGALASMHAMGETLSRRQMAQGIRVSPNSYRYLLAGLALPFVLWITWAAVSWSPVAGWIVGGTAALVSWVLATAGFGAALLSRGGLRTDFAGRLLPPEMLTDEFLWATPATGVTAARRPTGRTGEHRIPRA